MRTADVLDQLLQFPVLRVNERPLIDSGKEARLPVLGILDRNPLGHIAMNPGEIPVLGPEPVHDPGSDARPRLHGVAAVHQHQRRFVIGHLGVH